MNHSQTPFEQEVAACIVKALNLEMAPDAIAPEQPLFQEGLGLDSIDVLEIYLVVSKNYGVQFGLLRGCWAPARGSSGMV